MIKVYVGNNVDRWPVLCDPNTTLRAILEQEKIDYSRASMHLDGATLQPGDLDKTFAELGIKSQCFLLSVQKLDNAR